MTHLKIIYLKNVAFTNVSQSRRMFVFLNVFVVFSMNLEMKEPRLFY